MRTDAEAKQQIVEIVQDLFAMGQLTPTGGNVSAFGTDPELLWITREQAKTKYPDGWKTLKPYLRLVKQPK